MSSPWMTQVGFKVNARVLIRGTQKRDVEKGMPLTTEAETAVSSPSPGTPWTLDEARQATPESCQGAWPRPHLDLGLRPPELRLRFVIIGCGSPRKRIQWGCAERRRDWRARESEGLRTEFGAWICCCCA